MSSLSFCLSGKLFISSFPNDNLPRQNILRWFQCGCSMGDGGTPNCISRSHHQPKWSSLVPAVAGQNVVGKMVPARVLIHRQIPNLWKCYSSSLYSTCSCKFVLFMRRSVFRIFLCHHLNLRLSIFLLQALNLFMANLPQANLSGAFFRHWLLLTLYL